jgi:hypothetical protein
MSNNLFILILSSAGFLTGISWTLFNGFCFATITSWLNDRKGFDRSIGWGELVGYSLGALFSCSFLLVLILATVWWTNHYPEWRRSKDVFWFGVIAGVVMLRLIGRRRR